MTKKLVRQNFGPWLAITQFVEQGNIYNAFNSSIQIYLWENSTVNGFGVNLLWCPSDAGVIGLREDPRPRRRLGWDSAADDLQQLRDQRGPLYYFAKGIRLIPCSTTIPGSSTTSATRTGTSIAAGQARFDHRWDEQHPPGRGPRLWRGGQGDRPVRTELVDLRPDWRHQRSHAVPPNFFKSWAAGNAPPMMFSAGENNYTNTFNSYHSGGCNFLLCDGSVRFIKNTVNSWNPFQIQYNGRGSLYTGVGGALPAPGVYQALSTRNGGEVISADAYSSLNPSQNQSPRG